MNARKVVALGERVGVDHSVVAGDVLGAIDVGSNAVRLKLARLLPDGSFEPLHQERDPVRPGEGVWETGIVSPAVEARLTAVLSRYARVCREHGAHVRAVATSALREAKNRDDVTARIRVKAGLELEVISGQEEARLIGLGALRGLPATSKSLLVDIGGGSTEVARATGEEPAELWSIPLGAVRLTAMFDLQGDVDRDRLVAARRFAQRVARETLPASVGQAPRHALGSSGTIRAIAAFAAAPGTARATRESLSRAVDELVALGSAGRRKRFDAGRADIVVAGAIILEAVAHHLQLDTITAVDGGLKEGLLVDLVKRSEQRDHDPLLSDAVLAAGRRFGFEEAHALHTRDTALALYDQLGKVHHLPGEARLILEVAAMLHDVGTVISRARHHKHSQYLIQNLDLPGLSDHERDLAGLVARFHRRSAPRREHEALKNLPTLEARVVRKLSTLLRFADATDRARQQAVAGVWTSLHKGALHVHLRRRRGCDLPPWDLEGDRALFRSVFGRRLEVHIDGDGELPAPPRARKAAGPAAGAATPRARRP